MTARQFRLEPDFQRHRIRLNDVAGGQNRHALDDVAQLARVAGPGVRLQDREHGIVDPLRPEVVARQNSSRKYSASARMSSGRSRSGGTRIGTTLSR